MQVLKVGKSKRVFIRYCHLRIEFPCSQPVLVQVCHQPVRGSRYGPGRMRVEKGAAEPGTVQAYCVGQPESVAELRQMAVKL